MAATANVAQAEEKTVADSGILVTEQPAGLQGQAAGEEAAVSAADERADQTGIADSQPAVQTQPTVTASETAAAGQTQAGSAAQPSASAATEVPAQPEEPAAGQKEQAATQESMAANPAAAASQEKEAAKAPAANVETQPSAASASSAGQSGFYNAAANAQTARSNPQAEIKGSSFVDVSSHNGQISVEDYRKLAQQGVGGVVVKLTEGTTYTNPFAESQVKNAQGAGLQVSTYAFSHYTSDEEARAEARYYVSVANRLGLSKSTVMVNDMEDPKMQNGINQHTQAWADEMRRLGYANLMYYTSASWLDQNNLRSKGPVNTAQFGYSNFWVAQYPSANLKLDSAKSLKYNSGAGAWQFTSQAQLLAGKHVFDHSIDYTGRFTKQSALANQPLKGDIGIQNNNTANGSFDVVISNVSAPYGVSAVKVPVWSEVDGQDDIIWYEAGRQANGTYKITVESSRHKNSTGQYNVHLYYVRNDGQLVGVSGTKTTVSVKKPEGTLSIQNKNNSTGEFDIVVSGIVAPQGLERVYLPTWSAAGGQDDIQWYTAERQADGTYRQHVSASNHKDSLGEYNIHLYYVNSANQLQGVASVKTTVAKNQSKTAQGKISIQNKNQDSGEFDIVVSEIHAPQGLARVYLPTWSTVNDQDDIQWYTAERQADGTYKKHVKASDHKNSVGDYNVHLYYVTAENKLQAVAAEKTKVVINKPQGKISIQNNNRNSGEFDIVVSDIVAPEGLKTVYLPTWSTAGGQDDVKWYEAQRQADGTYKQHVKAGDHKDSLGEYNIHLYYLSNAGKLQGVAMEKTTVSKAAAPRAVQGKISIQNQNQDNGDFEILVSGISAPNGVKTVYLPTWSEAGGQDDVQWYVAERQADGTYKKHVSASNHDNGQGDYNIHLYYADNDGKLHGVASAKTKVTISKPQGKISIQNKNNDTGEFDIVVSGIVAPEGLKTVYLPTWSTANGQDDVQWYTAERQGDGSYRKHVHANQHKNVAGEYNIHLYYLNNQGQLQGVGMQTTAISVNRPQPVSSQRDRVLAAAAALVGVRGGSAEHQRLVNDYNSVRPLPVGYAVKNTDDWCDVFTTVVFQREGLSDLIGRECGVERHIQIFKNLGIWNEDGNTTPKAGDIITFNWDQNSQQNNGWADHIGIVEKVENGIIHTIEGNSNNQVKRNTYRIGHGNIRGFATPRYK
nr:GBS Bsp-like repeat-containing protein [Streptococcus panodentis]